MQKSFDEINEKIQSGKVVVVTAEEVVAMAAEQGVEKTARQVDVVTCATFGAMCSSGAFINFGHSDEPIRMAKVSLNDVPLCAGLAAVDAFIGATELSDTQGMNYGGAHVISDLIAGKRMHLKAWSYGTDCYPKTDIDTYIDLNSVNQAYMFNPRNCYQNYNAATNSTERMLHTYMGALLPNCGNVTYSTSGELSPLLKDPELRAIGVGTRIFMGGAQGYVAWQGTQHVSNVQPVSDGVNQYSGGTLALIGDMKQMNPRYVRGATMEGYGVTMFMGVGIPVPVLDADLLAQLAMPNRLLYTDVYDYSVPSRSRPTFRKVSYEELRSGSIELGGKKTPTSPLSSLKMAREIAQLLKGQIARGEFLLQAPIQALPKDNVNQSLKEVEA